MTTLSKIRTKVRRLTASPSPTQLSDTDIDDYVNTFYLHDLPSRLKLLSLKTVYTFYTEPGVTEYTLNVDPSFTATTPLAYYTVEPPLYIAGYESYFTQDRTEFFRLYPEFEEETEQAGDGTAGPFSLTATNTPVLRNKVTVSATSPGGTRLIAYDDGSGSFTGDVTAGSIDYDTGAVTNLTFTSVVPATENITLQTVPYQEGRPSTVLFYNNKFTVRQVPDKTYRVDLNAYIYPTVLLNGSDNPQVDFIWQLIAIGASKKIFEDRGDIEAVQMLMPNFEEQLLLSERKFIAQNKSKRSATIYSGQTELHNNFNYNWF